MRYLIFIFACFFTAFAFAQEYKVPVYTVTSLQNPESGNETMYAIDGDIYTMYHSKWYVNGIPDQLNFYFPSNIPGINKIVYTPRQSQLNGVWTNISVSYSTQSQPDVFLPLFDNIIWAANNEDKVLNISPAIENVAIIRFDISAAYGNFSSCAEMSFYSEFPYNNADSDCTISTESLQLDGANDIKAQILLSGSTASSYQYGENIEKSFDGNLNTLYHSSWSNTIFPVVLNYRLDGNTEIDYLKYIPRSDGGTNGNFGNVSIKYNTLGNSNYQNLMDYDFEQLSMPQILNFPNTITPANIQITIYDGAGGFASCAEMEFYTKGNTVENPIPENIFADDLCSELLPGVSQTDINAIANSFFRQLAQCIFDGNYNHQYRVQEYEVYKPYHQLQNELKINSYDQFENSTGIVFEAGEKIALFVGDIPTGVTIAFKIKNYEDGYYGDETYHYLHSGLNVFENTNTGLAYISYYNNNLNLPKIPINIVSGKVNGYFDVNTSNSSEWVDLLMNTNYPKIDLRGDYTHLVFDKSALKSGCPFEGKALIQTYDSIVRHEWMLMGFFKYDIAPKNRMFGFIEDGNGYYAGHLGIHLDISWGLSNVTDPYNLELWGIAHEFGHVNQIWPDINWIGTTEVTNNIYSLWVYYNMNQQGKKYTRLEDSNDKFLPGSPNIVGGTINGTINSAYVHQKALQEGLDNMNYSVFNILVPFWQLELYYQLAGACKNAPALSFDYPGDYTGVDYAHWFGTVAEKSRNTNNVNWTHGQMLANFVKNTCDAVQEDLTEFFINTGFLRPIDKIIDDYGEAHLLLTQEMIDDVIAYVQSQNYEQPVSPVIHYLSANTMEVYRDKLALQGENGVGVQVAGNKLYIQNSDWQNAVAFEVYSVDNELIHVAIMGTGDISLQTTTVYYPENADEVWAIGYDGAKILVYPNSTSICSHPSNNLNLKIYPNPSGNGQNIHIAGTYGIYSLDVFNISGTKVSSLSGNLSDIEKDLNNILRSLEKGVFFFEFKTENGEKSIMKYIQL